MLTSRYTPLHNEREEHIQAALVTALKLQTDNLEETTFNLSIYVSTKPEEVPIVIHSGASISLSPNKNDFIGSIFPSSITLLNGLSNTIQVLEEGLISRTIRDSLGTARFIQTKAY